MKNKLRAFSFIEISIVLIIIGILIVGVTQSTRLIKISRLQTAQSITQSSPVAGMKGVVIWLESTSQSSFVENDTSEGSTITVWNDVNPQSVKNNMKPVNALTSPAITGTDMVYKEVGISGLPVVNFAGTSGSYFTGSPIPTLGNKFTFFIVFQSTDTTSTVNRILYSNGTAGTNGWGYEKAVGGARTILVGSGAVTAGASSANPEVVSAIYDGTTLKSWVNGGSKVTGAVAETPPLTALYVGGTPTADTAWLGYIGEIILIEGALKDSDRYDIEKYLGKKWGIPMAVTPQ